MFVVKKVRYNLRHRPEIGEVVATFKKKAQAKSYVSKFSGGVNLGYQLLIEEKNKNKKEEERMEQYEKETLVFLGLNTEEEFASYCEYVEMEELAMM